MDEDRLFRALAHSTRRRIIKILAEEGPQTYSSLLRKTGLATGTLNHHLEKMREILEVRDGLYDLTEVGWRAYQAMKVVEGSLSGAVRRSSPLDLVIRPSKGFREFAGSFPLGHVIVAFLIGIFSILLSLTVSDPVSVAVNSFVPPLFTAMGARLAYRTSNFKNFFASYPATLLPMILIPVLLRLAPFIDIPGAPLAPTYFIASKLSLVWFFYLLFMCSRYSLELDMNEAFVVTVVGIFAGRVVLDSFNGMSLLLG